MLEGKEFGRSVKSLMAQCRFAAGGSCCLYFNAVVRKQSEEEALSEQIFDPFSVFRKKVKWES